MVTRWGDYLRWKICDILKLLAKDKVSLGIIMTEKRLNNWVGVITCQYIPRSLYTALIHLHQNWANSRVGMNTKIIKYQIRNRGITFK